MIRQPQIVVGTEQEHIAAVKPDVTVLGSFHQPHAPVQPLPAQLIKFVAVYRHHNLRAPFVAYPATFVNQARDRG